MRHVLGRSIGLATLALVGFGGGVRAQETVAAVARADVDAPASPKARAAADRALEWLLRAQNPDGSWGDNPAFPGEVGNTCIAALALMATGDTISRGEHSPRIRRAVEWLLQRTRGVGAAHQVLDRDTLLQRKLGENIDLYLVALLWSQVLGQHPDVEIEVRIQTELRRMADCIGKLQKPNGEWETTYEPMLTTIVAWLALRQAHDAGVAVNRASPEKVVEYLQKECLQKDSGVFREKRWNHQVRFVTQAGALRVYYGMGLGGTPEARLGTDVLLKMRFDQDVGGRSGGEEFLGALFATQALYTDRSAAHARWYPKITDGLIACQNKDGSWLGHHCITGRVFCTSCAIMTLLTPDDLLPMIER